MVTEDGVVTRITMNDIIGITTKNPVITGITSVIWIGVMLLTRPESSETLESFYRKARPGGPGWRLEREATGIRPDQPLSKVILQSLAAMMIIYGLMFTVGGVLLLNMQQSLGLEVYNAGILSGIR